MSAPAQALLMSGVASVPFSQVILLVHADGTNGSTTFTDSSSFAHASSFLGNAQLSTAQFKFGTASILFDGTGDQVSYASASEYNLSGNNFTLNFWLYSTNTTQVSRRFVGRQADTSPTASTSEYVVAINSTGAVYCTVYSGGVSYVVGLEAWSRYADSTWHFVEVTREGSTFTLRIDSVIIGRVALAGSLQNGTWATRLGSFQTSASECLDGRVDELRLINGSAVVHRTNPVAAFSNSSVEASDGGTDTLDPYIASVLLHLTMEGQGTATAFVDCSPYFRAITKGGNVQYDTSVKPFGFSSAAFDGAGDFLTVPDSADWLFVNADFTVEAMCYFTNFTSSPAIVGQYATLSNKSWSIRATSITIQFWWTTNGTTNNSISFNWYPSTTTWYHLAVVRSGNNLMLFVDGIQQEVTKTLTATNIFDSSLVLCIGSTNSGSFADLNGKMKSLRITSDNRYDSATYTQPPAAFPDSSPSDPDFSSVKLLLHCEGSNGSTTVTDSSSGARTATVNGNAQISTAQFKYGSASLLFDGAGDYVTFPTSSDFDFAGGFDITIELWMYPTSFSKLQGLIGNRPAAGGGGWQLYLNTTGTISVDAWDGTPTDNMSITTASAVTLNAWNHVALQVNATQSRGYIFLNGTLAATVLRGTVTAGSTLHIGRDAANTARDYIGYLDEIRITKGVLRYSPVSFATPTALFPRA